MRNLKKALALALASVMLMGMMVVGTSAADFTDVTATDNVEAIEVMQAAGIMIGDAGKFNPDKKVSRNEMAVIMTNLLDLDTAAYTGTSPFTDVPAWAEPFVAACYANGIVSGTSATTYGGEGGVTATQAALMVMKALGYFQYASDFGSDWQVATVKQADKIDLFDDIDCKVTATLTRNEAAQLVLNALCCTMVEAEDNGIGLNDAGALVSKYKYVAATASYNAKYDAIDGTNTTDSTPKSIIQLGEKLFGGDLELDPTGAPDVDAFGRPAYTWEYKGDIIGTYADTADYVVVVDDDYTAGSNLLADLKELTDDEDLKATSVTYYINGDYEDALSSAYTAADVEGIAVPGLVIEIYKNNVADADEITDVVAYFYVLDQITGVDTEMTTAEEKAGHACEIIFNTYSNYYDDEIVGFDAKTYVKDAYVALIVNLAGDVVDSFIPATVKGSVSNLNNTDKFFTMNGTKYLAAGAMGMYALTSNQYADLTSVTVGADATYELYLDANNNVIGVKTVAAAAAKLDEVYYVDEIWLETSSTFGASGNVTKYFAQLIDMNGVISTVELEAADKNDTVTGGSTPGKDDTLNDAYVNSTTAAWGTEGEYEGKLVTITDKKWVNEAGTTTYKAGNGKYDLTLWTNSDFDLYSTVTLANGLGIEKADTRLSATASKNGAGAAGATFRLGANTKYILVEGTKGTLETAVVTGGINFTVNTAAGGNMNTTNAANIVITAEDSMIAQYVILITDKNDQATVYGEDVVFITTASAVVGDGYREQTVYSSTGEKLTWKVDADEYVSGGALYSASNKFFTFETNADGYVTLSTPVTLDANLSTNVIWKDQEGVVDFFSLTDYTDLYTEGGVALLTVDAGTDIAADVDVSNAKFVDLRGLDTATYDRAINSLARLFALIDAGTLTATDVDLAINVTKDGATVIFLLNTNA